MPWRSGNRFGSSSSAANEPKAPIHTKMKTVESMPETGSAAGSTRARYQMKEPDDEEHEDERQRGDALVVGLDHQRQHGDQAEQRGRVVLGAAEGGVALGGGQQDDGGDDDQGGHRAGGEAERGRRRRAGRRCRWRRACRGPEVPPVVARSRCGRPTDLEVRGARTLGSGGCGGLRRDAAAAEAAAVSADAHVRRHAGGLELAARARARGSLGRRLLRRGDRLGLAPGACSGSSRRWRDPARGGHPPARPGVDRLRVDGLGWRLRRLGLELGLGRDDERVVRLEVPRLAIGVDLLALAARPAGRRRPGRSLGEHGRLEDVFLGLPVVVLLAPGGRGDARLLAVAAVEDGGDLPGRRVVPVRQVRVALLDRARSPRGRSRPPARRR